MRYTLLFLMLSYAGISNASDELISTSPCPGLVSSYGVEEFEQALVITDHDFASIEDCEQLGSFFFRQTPSRKYTLDYSRVGDIVDSIWRPVSEEAPFLLIGAIFSWMKDLGFEQHAESFRDFINEYMPAGEKIQLFFSILMWLIVIAVLTLVLVEFYRAGMLKLPRYRRKMRYDQEQESRAALQWQAILALPLRPQISALLHYSIERLAARKLLPATSSFTNRELISCLEKSDAEKVPLLREQIELTEPVVYGDGPVSEERIIACRAKARALSDA
jgi:hypothetical protein